MKKILLSTIILSTILLVGCGKKEEKKDPIIGDWGHGSYVYTFNEDKTCNYSAGGTDMKCTYTIEDDKLSILFDGNTAPFETTFKIENDTLIIKDSFDNDVEYTKK